MGLNTIINLHNTFYHNSDNPISAGHTLFRARITYGTRNYDPYWPTFRSDALIGLHNDSSAQGQPLLAAPA